MGFNIVLVESMPMEEEIYFPTEEQLFGLYRFLVLLRSDRLFWHAIEPRGDRILIKVEEPRGEIDLRVFYVYEDGEVKPDDFRD